MESSPADVPKHPRPVHRMTRQMVGRRVCALLALCVVVTLSACGAGGENGGGPARARANDPASRRAVSAPDTAPTRAPEAPRIVVLGDSLTAGLGLPVDLSFPARLQATLDEAGYPHEIVNAGESGGTSAGGLRRLERSLEGDVRVLVLALGANDGLRGLAVDEMKANLAEIIQTARARGVAVLLAGMEQLGLDPRDIEYVIVLHGHADHYGGSPHLQGRFGARVVASEADWDLMDGIDAGGGQPPGPTRDVTAAEGEPIRLGDGVVTPFLVPGHTPGAISVVFPVRDGADSYIAAVFGGTALTVPRLGDALPQYLQSIDRFASIASDLGVNVVLQNHPLFDGMPGKLERLRDRGAGERHPFVLDAPDSYERFMATLSECSQAQVAAAENREG